MSDDSSEEKKHPASQRKLQKQREKGSVPQSQDTLHGVVTVVGLVYLFFTIARAREIGLTFFNLEYVTHNADFVHVVKAQLILIGELVALFVMPMMLLVSVMSIAIGVFISGGFVFSTEPLTPDFDKFNPASGLKRIFGIRAMKVFGMHLLRIALVGSIVLAVIYFYLPTILATSTCDLTCGITVNEQVYFYVFSVLIAASILFAVFDFIVQKAEFMRENKMTDTEVKQEQKEQNGSPEIKSKMREIRNEVATKITGVNKANFILADSFDRAIGIFYERGGNLPPIVVSKARGRGSVIRMMSRSGKPVEHDPELVQLIKKVDIGDPVVDEASIMAMVPYLQTHT